MLDEMAYDEEEDRAREEAAIRSSIANTSSTGPRKRKTLLSRLLPFGLIRGTFRGNGPSDYL